MSGRFILPGAIAALVLGGLATPALADFSGCASALMAQDPHEKIALYTTCITHGGVPATDIAAALNNRGVAYRSIGEIDKALQDFNWSIDYDPKWPNAYVNRSVIEEHRGQCREAVADADIAVRLQYWNWLALNQKAWVLATCSDPSVRNSHDAIDLAQRSLKRGGRSRAHDTLAAAFAEAGQFDDAQREEETALNDTKIPPAERSNMEARLQLYRSGQPFHEAAAPSVKGG
jgi:tetratricopeptide (TPR) repeat protein